MVHIQPVGVGVVRKDERYLLTLRHDPDHDEGSAYNDHWQFPGGGVEFGETVEECLIGEMKEEIGTDVRIIALLPQVFTAIRETWHGILIPYLCELVDADAQIVLNNEASDFGWFTLDEIPGLKKLS